jgi:hypothetical protein
MINVTLGEVKTQKEKPFPKLMIGDVGTVIMVLQEPNKAGRSKVFNLTNCRLSNDFAVFDGSEKFTDYNQPITLQNA